MYVAVHCLQAVGVAEWIHVCSHIVLGMTMRDVVALGCC